MRDDTTVDAREGAKHGAGARKHARTSLTSNDTRTITSTFWSARSVAAHGRSWWPSRDGVKTRTATDQTTRALTPTW
jgi:hypothetical protein